MASLPWPNVVPTHVTLPVGPAAGRAVHPTIGVPAWLKETVPPSTLGEIVAVSVTTAPAGAGFSEAASVVVVPVSGTAVVGAEFTGTEEPSALTALTPTTICEPAS